MASYDKLLNKLLLHNHNGRDVTGGDVGSKVAINSIQFDITSPVAVTSEGSLQWNDTDGTLNLGMSGGDISMQIGQELFTKVRNDAGYETISNGQAVYISGRNGVYPTVRKARADSETTSRVLGIATQDIASPAFGYITTVGYVRGIKTNYTGAGIWGTTWVTGDLLYVSKTDAGVLTNVEPSEPHHSDTIGTVGVVSSNQGSILITLDRHKTLSELSDVDGTALTTTGQLPVWNQTAGYFDFNYNVHRQKVAIKSGDYTLTALDQVVVFTSTATATLPSATGTGQTYRIICRAGTLTIDGNSTDTIVGELTQTLTAGENLIITDTATGVWE